MRANVLRACFDAYACGGFGPHHRCHALADLYAATGLPTPAHGPHPLAMEIVDDLIRTGLVAPAKVPTGDGTRPIVHATLAGIERHEADRDASVAS
ncbi:MAG: hypothetical protein ACRENE_14880 [Polyangiaceae bacterium]